MSDSVIAVSDLSRTFGAFVAVDRVSFSVQSGEIFGYLGANGAGKSTTIKILCGLLRASSGAVYVAGVDVVANPNAVRSSIGYMSQKFSLYPDLTVTENMEFFGAAYGVFGERLRRRRGSVDETIGLCGVEESVVSSLPGGIRQRVALACAVLHEPLVVFLDEPTAGVDPEARRAFWTLIRRLAAQGTTVFVTTHYMDEAEYCDRVGLMVDGKLAALDTPDALKRSYVPGAVLEVENASPDRLGTVMAADPTLVSIEPFGAALHVRLSREGVTPEELAAALRARGLSDVVVRRASVSLEDVFLAVVRQHSRSDEAAP